MPHRVAIAPSVTQAWSAESTYHWLAFQSDKGLPSSLPAVESWAGDLVERTNRNHEDGIGHPGLIATFARDERTVVVLMDSASSRQTLMDEVERLRVSLEDAGCSGSVRHFPPPPRHFRPNITYPLYSTAICGSIPLATPTNSPSFPDQIRRKSTDPDALAPILDHALAWCEVPGGVYEVEAGPWREHLSATTTHALFTRLVTTQEGTVTLACSTYPDRSRAVTFTLDGRVTYAEADGHAHQPGEQALELATAVLGQLAPHLTYGFAAQTQASVTGNTSGVLHRSWPGKRPLHGWDGLRRWETLGGWDSFSVLLHGPQFPRISANTQYNVQDLPDSRQLLIHREAPRWLNGRNLTASDLLPAKDALGAALIDFAEVDRVSISRRIAEGDAATIARHGTAALIPDDHPMKNW